MMLTLHKKEIRSLTGIRGIACIWVLLLHMQSEIEYLGVNWIGRVPVIGSGWRGVDMFFMLSGFILFYGHESDFVTLNMGAIIRFAQLRFLRVYPLNAVVLGIIMIIIISDPFFSMWFREQVHQPNDFTAFAFVKTLFLATRWFLPGDGEWNGQVWSLSVEVLGYAAFPFIAWGLTRCRSARASFAVALASLGGLTIALVLRGSIDSNVIGKFSIVRMAGSFVAGAALCRTWRLTYSLQRPRFGSRVTLYSCLGLLISCLVPDTGLLALPSLAGIVFGLAFQQGIVNRFLASKPLMFLGRISFPLYLIHFVPLVGWIYWFGLSRENAIVLLPMYVISCLLTASILHYVIERPIHHFSRKWLEQGYGDTM